MSRVVKMGIIPLPVDGDSAAERALKKAPKLPIPAEAREVYDAAMREFEEVHKPAAKALALKAVALEQEFEACKKAAAERGEKFHDAMRALIPHLNDADFEFHEDGTYSFVKHKPESSPPQWAAELVKQIEGGVL